jgi:peptide/nickel transport system substrate-binding protein
MRELRESKTGRTRAAFVLALITLMPALAACGANDASTSGESGPIQRGGTLTVALSVEPTTLDPGLGLTDGSTQNVQSLVFNRLIEVQPGSIKLVPGLADHWSLNRHGQSATFHLRDARFSDGTPVTSSDVKFSFERAMDPETDAQWGESLAELIEAISTPDAHTVVLHFPGPRPAVFYYLAFTPLSIVNKAAFEKLGEHRFAAQPTGGGSGPFEVVKWTKGQEVELARNPYYWRKGLPYVDKVHLRYVPDDNTRILDLRAGQVDVAMDIPYSQIEGVEGLGDTLVTSAQKALYVAIWHVVGPLAPRATREALNYATPREVINQVVLHGQGEPANSMIPPMRYWDSSVKPYPYDLAKARQLLSQTDTPNGFPLTMEIRSGDAVGAQTAEILQNAWAKIGVKLNIHQLDFASEEQNTASGDWQMQLNTPTEFSSDIPSEDEYAINFTNPFLEHIFSFSDPKLRSLIARIENTWNEKVRERLFAQFQQEQMSNPQFLPLLVTTDRAAVGSHVRGFEFAGHWIYLDRTWTEG